MALLAGLVAAAALWWLLAKYRKANVKNMAGLLRKAAGILGFIVAGVLLMRGRIDMALLVAGAAAWAYGELPFRLPFNLPFQGGAATGRMSRARTAFIEMTINHDNGAFDGMVVAGPRAGARLGRLSLADILDVRRACLAQDPDGARLLEAYLDSRFPAWRENADGNGDAGSRGGVRAGPGTMTEQEAYEVLGLAPGAGAEEIRGAYRTLMKRLHPDQGGTTWLAARVNQAKDVLLARHR